MEKIPIKTRFIGRLAFGTAWAPDFFWDLTDASGAKHKEFAAIKIVQRAEFKCFEVSLGPVFILFTVLPK